VYSSMHIALIVAIELNGPIMYWYRPSVRLSVCHIPNTTIREPCRPIEANPSAFSSLICHSGWLLGCRLCWSAARSSDLRYTTLAASITVKEGLHMETSLLLDEPRGPRGSIALVVSDIWASLFFFLQLYLFVHFVVTLQ